MAMNGGEERLELPPGFRFHPTDEEIITHYLSQKVLNHKFIARAIGEVDLNRSEPWDLPNKAKMGEKEWYFFCQRDRKYPTGMRTNRATEAGYWKATGKDKEIYRREVLVGMKKTLVFYKGRAPKGEKTNWVMHEFRLEGKSSLNLPKSAKDEWAVCRVFHKNLASKTKGTQTGFERINSYEDHDGLLDSPMPALMDPAGQQYFPAAADGENFDFKSINLSFSNLQMMAFDNQQNFVNPQLMNNTCSTSSPNYAPFYLQNSSQSFHPFPGFANSGSEFLQQDDEASFMANAFSCAKYNIPSSVIIRRDDQCKMEQYSSHSIDTVISTDQNTEISSVISQQPYDEFDDFLRLDQM